MLRRLSPSIYPLALVAALVLGWELVTRFGVVPVYLLPAPERVAAALLTGLGSGKLVTEAAATLTATVAGFGLGAAMAIPAGVAVAELRWAERLFLLPLTAFQTIPKVALAPLVFMWVGFGLPGTIVLAALSCFYPIFVGTVTGLRSVDPLLLDVYRVQSASAWPIFRDIKLPAAAGHVLSGLQIAMVFSFITTVVMEFIVSSKGLGYVIQDTANTMDLPLNFAALVLLAILGIGASSLIRRIRSSLIFWERGRSYAMEVAP